ncbi:MAG: hypothetical protein RIQ52_581 [Pseudomonadota bacterium]|jgi:asparagine synthase (glutamine-hydrolysing)
MCGIAGMVLRYGQVQTDDLDRMRQQLQHRGPDGHGLCVHENVGLVHTRLSIIDLAGGQQPLHSAEDDCVLVANGEIYNYLELREALLQQGARFATHSDSEVVLEAYRHDPDGFIDALNGMFAFALHDRRRQRVVIARDRLGIKPLFYVQLADRVLFASEIKALLPLLPHPPELMPKALSQFLGHQFSSGDDTVFAGIRRLGPGEMLSISTTDLSCQRRVYWDLTRARTLPAQLSLQDAESMLDELLEQVMREHMRSDVPYGLFLSGGNDSAVLLAQLTRLQDRPVRTFSVGYADSQMGDELAPAMRMADYFGSDHTELRLSRHDLFRRIPHTVWACDELMRDPASLPTSALAETAAAELKVVFSGEGGDEVFAGYGRYRQPAWIYRFKSLLASGSGGFRTRSHWQGGQPYRALGRELAAGIASARSPFVAAWQRAPKAWTHLQHCQYTDLVTALPDNLLVKADRMLMGFAVEGRVPFLDHRLVEFGLMLPDRLKCQGKVHKRILRSWAERHIPPDHLYHRKRGFHVPVGEWLSGAFLDSLEKRLMANVAIRRWFRVEQLPALFAAQRHSERYSREIFALMQFAIWHRMFIEQPGLRPQSSEDPLDWVA